MPISPITLQRRHAELGRIRLGNQVPVGTSGRNRPNKLQTFRFTSPSEEYIRSLATLYGGEARPWKNGSKNEWEVYSEAKSIPVIVIKGGLSQWMETWSGGGCTHRCDGVTNVLTDEDCNPNDPDHINAKPTTRVAMMLPDLDAIGGFRLETHGWNAAAEIPAVAELAQFVGDLVPAVLHLVERTSVKDGKTSQFVVPVLDLKIGTQRLRELVAQKMGEPLALAPAAGDGPPALPGPGAAVPDYLGQAQQCSTADAVGAIWRKAYAAGHLTDQLAAELRIVGDSLVAAPDPAAGPDADGAYDAEVIDETSAADADRVWQLVLAEAGRRQWTEQQTLDGYAEFSGGEMAISASASQLEAYLGHLKAVAA